MNSMHLEILTPEKTYFSGEVESVTLPGTMGSFQVLKNYALLISSLTKGKLSFKTEGEIETMEIMDGFVEVSDNKITVCIDSLTDKH